MKAVQRLVKRLYWMNPLAGFHSFSVAACCLILAAGCASAPVQPGAAAGSDPEKAQEETKKDDAAKQVMKTFATPEEYLKEATVLVSVGRTEEARKYITEGINRAPNNQAVRNMAGVAYARMGKGDEAKVEFQTAVKLNPNSPEAATANQWLEKFKKPLPIAIYPLKIQSNILVRSDQENFFDGKSRSQSFKDDFDKVIEREFYTKIKDVLEKSGFYKIVQFDANDIEGQINPSAACREAAEKGALIAIVCKNSSARYTENASIGGKLAAIPLRIIFGALLNSNEVDQAITEGVISWDVSVNTTMDIYEANKGRVVKSVSKSGRKEVSIRNVDEKVKEVVDKIYEDVALEIHHALM